MQGVAPRGLVVVVVVGRGWAPERVPPVVVVAAAVAATFRKAIVVVMVMGKMMIRIWIRFLGLILDPGRLQGYV